MEPLFCTTYTCSPKSSSWRCATNIITLPQCPSPCFAATEGACLAGKAWHGTCGTVGWTVTAVTKYRCAAATCRSLGGQQRWPVFSPASESSTWLRLQQRSSISRLRSPGNKHRDEDDCWIMHGAQLRTASITPIWPLQLGDNWKGASSIPHISVTSHLCW